jgi:hypothetical protein
MTSTRGDQDGLEFSVTGWKSAPQGDNVALI